MSEQEIEILNYFADAKSELGFFQVARRFGHSDADLPALMSALVESGYLSVSPASEIALYRITEKGNLVLAQKQ